MFVGEDSVLRYFYLNPDDGTITLRRSLEGASVNQFNVSVFQYCSLLSNVIANRTRKIAKKTLVFMHAAKQMIILV